MKKTIIIFLISLSFLNLLFPADLKEEKNEQLIFAITTLSSINLQSGIGEKFSDSIRTRLQMEKSFMVDEAILQPEKEFITECSNGKCPQSFLDQYRGKIVIIGSITRIIYKIGEKPISKYAIEDLMDEKFILSMQVVDTRTGKIDLSIKKEFAAAALLDAEAGKISNEIRDYYFKAPVKPVIKAKEEEKIKSKEVEKNIEKKSEKKSERIFAVSGIGIAPAFIIPLEKFARMSDFGFGGEVEVFFSFLKYRNIYLNLGLEFYGLNPTRDNIKSDWILSPRISAGYIFTIAGNFFITPYMQAGYIFQFVNGDINAAPGSASFNYKNEIFYNPSFGIGAEIGYRINSRIQLYLSPSYHFFIEQNSVFHFMKINIGIRMNWEP